MKIGILGGGQLARMIALAGHELGKHFVTLDPAAEACAASVTLHIQKHYLDEEALRDFASQVDVVTYEFENVPAISAMHIESTTPIHPRPRALIASQDRLSEKSLFRELGIATPPFAAIHSLKELRAAVGEIGLPCVLKTRSEGYDGKGQFVLRSTEDIDTAWQTLKGAPAILEGFVPFQREISIIAMRSPQGEVRSYPISENVHERGILIHASAKPGDPMQAKAEDYVQRLLNHLDYVGVVALELFQVGDQLLANEFAPRVHNTGHWTMNGAETCQFENHVRAICGLPLGATDLIGYAATINIIGALPNIDALLRTPYTHLHLYDKAPRAGRKIGHVNVRCDNKGEFERVLATLIASVKETNQTT